MRERVGPGLPYEIAETGLGHKIGGIAGTYLISTIIMFGPHFRRCSRGVHRRKGETERE